MVVIDPSGGRVDDESREQLARARPRARRGGQLCWRDRGAVTPDDICLFIYTSGTTGPPKGCLLTHGRSITDAAAKNSVLEDGDSAHPSSPGTFAILIQFVVFDLGTTLAYWSRDPKQIIADLAQVRPPTPVGAAYLPERLHDGHLGGPGPREARPGGGAGREGAHGAEQVPAELETAFDAAEEALYKNEAPVGGPHQGMRHRCAPIAPEILRFFYACGVPVMEGYGMTDSATSATVTVPPTVARWAGRAPTAWRSGSPTMARCWSRPEHGFKGYYKNEAATGEALEDHGLHTGDLGLVFTRTASLHHRRKKGNHHHRGPSHARQPGTG